MNYLSYTGSKGKQIGALLPLLGQGDLLVSPMCGGAALEVAALESGAFQSAALSDASPYPVAVLEGVKRHPSMVMAEKERVRAYIKSGGDKAGMKPLLEECQRGIHAMLETEPRDPVQIAGYIVGALSCTFSGLWRVNGAGVMNADVDPRGDRQVLTTEGAQRYHALLQRCSIEQSPWDAALLLAADAIARGLQVVIYADPPYLGDTTTGVWYGRRWDKAEATRFAHALAALPCRVIVSEQDKGGGSLYSEIFGVDPVVLQEIRRNVAGHQIAKVRRELAVVRPAL